VNDDGFRTARYLAVPIDLYTELQSHNDAVGRDLVLLVQSGDASPIARQISQLLDARYDHLVAARTSYREQIDEARAQGKTHVDLSADFRPSDVELAHRFVQLLEDADDLARSGEMLVARASPEVAHLRRWFADELEAQVVHGGEPRRYEPPSA
jgi:hypothetical protein